jgi:hypothetical protein
MKGVSQYVQYTKTLSFFRFHAYRDSCGRHNPLESCGSCAIVAQLGANGICSRRKNDIEPSRERLARSKIVIWRLMAIPPVMFLSLRSFLSMKSA